MSARGTVLIDCIVENLRPGSTIADVTLVYESDPIPNDQIGNPPPDSVDAAVGDIKTSGKMGGMPVNPSTLVLSCEWRP